MKTLLPFLFAALSFSTLADWQLQNDASQLHFISIKNEHIAETHTFDTLSGSLDSDGNLSINIPLASVNTLIPIRDDRMREHLFNIATNPVGSFTAKLPEQAMSLPVGQSKALTISGELMLNDRTAGVSFDVLITRLHDDKLQAVTIKPTVLNASQFDYIEGLGVLQSLAGLSGISRTVPVSFYVTFQHSE